MHSRPSSEQETAKQPTAAGSDAQADLIFNENQNPLEAPWKKNSPRNWPIKSVMNESIKEWQLGMVKKIVELNKTNGTDAQKLKLFIESELAISVQLLELNHISYLGIVMRDKWRQAFDHFADGSREKYLLEKAMWITASVKYKEETRQKASIIDQIDSKVYIDAEKFAKASGMTDLELFPKTEPPETAIADELAHHFLGCNSVQGNDKAITESF
eukprot:Filipodium_phascolosomae@DN6045_c0_g1_i1.p1